jgi:hypothetical protein
MWGVSHERTQAGSGSYALRDVSAPKVPNGGSVRVPQDGTDHAM